MASQISQETGQNVQVLCNEVPKAWAMKDAYCQLIPCNDEQKMAYGMIPRLGAFEITYNGVLIFSKLLTNVWPNVPGVSEKVSRLLKDASSGMSEDELQHKYQTDGGSI